MRVSRGVATSDQVIAVVARFRDLIPGSGLLGRSARKLTVRRAWTDSVPPWARETVGGNPAVSVTAEHRGAAAEAAGWHPGSEWHSGNGGQPRYGGLPGNEGRASDAELVRRVGQGDERAFALLESRHRAALRKWCAARSRTVAEAEDLRQETLLRAWRGAGGFLGNSDVRTWLYRIVVNAAADELRRRARRPRETALTATDGSAWLTSVVSAPERTVIESVDLGRALACLPTHQRVVVTLIDLIGCTTAEAAAVCGVGEPTVRSRLSRGRRQLRALMSGSDQERSEA
ncbi:RNA polymerase sigma factor [Streptomyces sp. NPDC001315]|uniref:RNA polymerase sigma factor n=1 Tax=Streptomyces sp. NPDC001315 TaxID=3364562 RepID=UPI0036D1458D